MFVKLEKPDLIGGETLKKQKQEGPRRKIVGLEIHDRAIARHGCDVLSPEGEVIGKVTTALSAWHSSMPAMPRQAPN